MAAFRYVQPVRFGDVDHAGIVYYPRFFHYFHVTFEELFGVGEYRRLLDERRIGFPAVRVEVDYHAPLRYGDWIAVDTTSERVGRTSVTLRYHGTRLADGTHCAEGLVTCVAIDLDSFRALPLPDDLRTLFTSLS